MLAPKEYQSRALHWLKRYFQECRRLNSASLAYASLTEEIYDGQQLAYKKVSQLPGLPYVCLRIPNRGRQNTCRLPCRFDCQ